MPRGITVHETGGPEVLRWEAVEVADPGPGEVRIAVSAAGVNFIDIYFRSGLYPKALPFVLGLEGAGVLTQVGPDAGSLAVGDRVAWSGVPASYAEELTAPARSLVRVPDGVGDELAAASMLQGMTAHYLTHGVRETRSGDTALVHAAAGGTGLLLVQLLKAAGARVIGTCSTEEKAALVKGAGADQVVLYGSEDFVAACKESTGGRGVDVVYDSVGADTFDRGLESLRPRGLMVLFGQSSGSVPPLDLQRLNQHGSLFVTRPSLFHYIATPEEMARRATAVFDAIGNGTLEVRVGGRYPLSEAATAQEDLASRRTTGKLLLVTGED